MITVNTPIDEALNLLLPSQYVRETDGRQCALFDNFVHSLRARGCVTVGDYCRSYRLNPDRMIVMNVAGVLTKMPFLRKLHDRETQIQMLLMCWSEPDAITMILKKWQHGLPHEVIYEFSKRLQWKNEGDELEPVVLPNAEYF